MLIYIINLFLQYSLIVFRSDSGIDQNIGPSRTWNITLALPSMNNFRN